MTTKQSYMGSLGGRLVQKSFINIVIVSLGKMPAFFIPILIAFWFGISRTTDTFFLVYSVTMFITQCFVGSVKPIIVPFVSEKEAKKKHCNEFIANVLVLVLCISLVSAFLYILLSGKVINLAANLDKDCLALAKMISTELSPLIVVMACSSLLIGVLHSYKRFYVAAITPMIGSLTVILVGLLLRNSLGIHAICMGYIAGQFLVLLTVFFKAKKSIGRLKFSIHFLNRETLQFAKVASLQTLAIIVWSINPVVDNIMATYLGIGSISKLEYAYRLVHIPINLITTGSIVVLFSYFSQLYHEQGLEKLRKYTIKTVRIAFCGTLLLVIGLFSIASPAIDFIYGANNSITVDLEEMAVIYKYYLFSAIPHIVGLVFVRYHMITKNTHYIFKTSLISFFANILFNYILMNWIGLPGLALSTTVVMTVQCFFLILFFAKKTGSQVTHS